MKDEEFNLSEKIETWKEKAVITSLESIKVEDVKEFIRLLKVYFIASGDNDAIKQIDKLVGERLK